MCKDLDLKSDEKNISRTVGYTSRILDSCAYHLLRYFQGTWAFQSLRLSKRLKEGESRPVHGRLDDLESFYHVLFWISLQHAQHGLRPAELYDHITMLFDHAIIDDGKAYTNITKSLHMTSDMTVESAKFKNFPLLNLLLKLSYAFKVLYIAPPRRVKIGPPGKTTQQVGESYQTELANYEEELKFLNSDKGSNWMEVYFEDAIQFPDDEWGDTGFIFNEMANPEALNKRKFTDMTTSALRSNQGGDFLPEPSVKAEADEVTLEHDQPSSSRRRLN